MYKEQEELQGKYHE